MPPNEVYDYTLKPPGGKTLGFMLVRARPSTPRAWRRSGVPDNPSRRNINDTTYGNVADTLDHPEVWNDWSGGFGDAYEVPERQNSYHWARGFDLRFPRQAIHAQAPQLLASVSVLGPSGASLFRMNANYFIDIQDSGLGIGFNTFRGVLILGRGYAVALYPSRYPNTAGSAFLYVGTGYASFNIMYGNRPVLSGTYAYIPNLSSAPFDRMDMATNTWTSGPVPARWFQKSSGRTWWSTDGKNLNSIAGGADILSTTNYSASINIEGGISQDAISLDDQLHIGTPEGILQGSITGTFNNIAPDVGTLISDENCRDLTNFQGGIAFPQGPHIWWYKPSQGGNSELREVGPSSLFGNRSAIRGRFTCVQGNGKWLYAGLFTGSGSYFLVGRDASYPLPLVWHPLHDFLGLNVKVHRLHVDGITRAWDAAGTVQVPNRIWAATEYSYGILPGATAPIFVWPIPYGDNNPLSDVTFSPNYMGSARLDLPASEWGAPGAAKVWRQNETWSEGLASLSQYADLYYLADQGARATLGRVTISPKTSTFFASGEGSFVRGQALALSIDSFTASINTTPVYRAFVTRGTLMPNSIDVIEARTHIGDQVRDRRGNAMRPAATMLRELRDMAKATAPSLLTDLSGLQEWVKVQAPIEEEEFYQEGESEPEVAALVHMSVMEFTE